MAKGKPLTVGIVMAVLLAAASLTAYAYAMVYQRPPSYQQPSGASMGNMMGGQQALSSTYQNPVFPGYGLMNPSYGPRGMMGGMMGGGMTGGGMMGWWGGYEPRSGWSGNWSSSHCPMMGAFYGKGYNATIWYNTVMIFNYAFNPNTLSVKKGTTVTWIDMDWVVHTVESGTHDQPLALFDSGPLGHMGAFSYTFNEVGTYRYHCDPHPQMEGTIIVVA